MSYTPNKVVQTLSSNTTALVTVTGSIPEDDTIPQNTEGTEVLTLSIVPKATNNILEIEFGVGFIYPSGSGNFVTLFQDSTANALATRQLNSDSAIGHGNGAIKYRMAAGTTSTTTFKIRMGNSGGGSIYVNGTSVGPGRLFGGTASTYLTIKEYLP